MIVDRRKFLALSAAEGMVVARDRKLSALGAASGDAPTHGKWGDQGDGSYINPILPGDFSDLDAIRVGEDYYAISSTFQYSPGVLILHSKDLVNWTLLGHVVPDLSRISADLGWAKMNSYGRGIWAGSLRFHLGRFWVYFNTPDDGFFMSTATNPAGPWSPVCNLHRASGWDDPCPFWDEDGQGYLIATQFSPDAENGSTYNIHLFKLSTNGQEILDWPGRIVHRSKGSEANKLYKIDGRYYHMYSEVHAEGRVVMMNRSRSLDGPWQTRQLNHVHAATDKEPNQGGLIQIPSGEWYFVTHQGTGDWEGRAGVLLSVSWVDGWPILGRVGSDGIGNMVWRGRKPIQGFPVTEPFSSDSFDTEALKPVWEWNYQPRAQAWSLTKRSGFLRLYGFQPLREGDFFSVGNVLTQRSMRATRCEVIVKLDLRGLADGQEAGFAHLAKTYCSLGVIKQGAAKQIVLTDNGVQHKGSIVAGDVVWLRSTWGFDGISQFAFSTDGRTYTQVGEPYALTWGNYRGDRLGLYTFGEEKSRGYVDFDFFEYSVSR